MRSMNVDEEILLCYPWIVFINSLKKLSTDKVIIQASDDPFKKMNLGRFTSTAHNDSRIIVIFFH